MKAVLFISMLLVSAFSFAKQIKDFNQMLMEDVRKDVRADNDQDLKARKAPIMRGPASITPERSEPAQDPKIEKVRQLGSKNW